MACLGCQLANGLVDSKIIYEDEYVACLLDIAPLNDGHTLIVPKRHLRELDELDEETMRAVMNASATVSRALKRTYGPDGISVMQNGGVFNDLDHFHLHVFPRYRGDGFGWLEPSGGEHQSLEQVRMRMLEAMADGA
ncbi:HIT family protein [Paenibacillus silvisoli]|uniref:HIT family protein n=1 Tax=Paenibacillus silvisoli TaxID=3110539 RepID=UPI0028046863|nr:HIT family protein [Paenibacillus silvisoli]